MSCPFCDIATMENKWYEDEYCYAVLEKEQTIKGYSLLIMKNHRDTITGVLNASFAEADGFWLSVSRLCERIKTRLGADAVYVVTLCEGIRHFHVHLIPRYPGSDIGFQYMSRIERDINPVINQETLDEVRLILV